MFDNFEKLLIRKPLFSYEILFDESGLSKGDVFFQSLLNDDKFLEAIYWSSISFYKTLKKYKEGKIKDEKKKKRILLSLKKFIIRSATRPIPFGAFAGISIQNISISKSNESNSIKRKLRIDMSILSKIIKSIENNHELVNHLPYQLNNTLYDLSNHYRFYEISRASEPKIQISSLDKSTILKRIITDLKNCKINFNQLYLKFKDEFDRDELLIFFKELVEMCFFISDIEINISAKDDFQEIKKFLNNAEIKNTENAVLYFNLIFEIENYIKKVEKASIGNFFPDEHDKLIFHLRKVGINIDNDEQLFHVDLIHFVNEDLSFSAKELKKINESIKLLSSISSENNHKLKLNNFKKIFFEKYESKAVPLLEVLDIDLGIGFPVNKSIGNNCSNFFESEFVEEKRSNNDFNLSDWLIDKIESNVNPTALQIHKSDLPDSFPYEKFPNTFYVVGQILDEGQILIQNVGGTSGSTLLSRFTNIDNDIEELCDRISNFEITCSTEVVFADIVWIENYKVGNISRRISHFEYEIPIFYESSKNQMNTIFLEDLLVSIQNNEIILTSKQLKKRVIPRLSNAHNYNHSNNPIYKFLCSIQNQKNHNFDLSLDFNKSFKRYFPRIFYENIILLPAHWIMHRKEIKPFEDEKNQYYYLSDYFKKWNFSQFVLLVQGDNELLIDTHNEAYLDILLDELKKNERIILKESFINPSKKDGYINQFILPLKKSEPTSEFAFDKIHTTPKVINRNYFPGSEWIYFKIYCSNNVSNDVLIEIHEKLILYLKEEGLIHKWFFVRFFDPHHHLRLRFNISSRAVSIDIQKLLYEKLKKYLKNEIVWKIKIDTYQREIERYGIDNITNSETLFYHDSELYIHILKSNCLEDVTLNLCLAVKNIDFWFSLIKIDLFEKISICDTMKEKLSREKSSHFLLDVEKKYREYRTKVFDFMDEEEFLFLFEKQKNEMKDITINKSNISDYIHMSINRWFPHNQRDWEYLLYHFCLNYYKKNAYKSKLN